MDIIIFSPVTLTLEFDPFLENIRAFIWAFLVTRFSYWYQDICPCDLDHLWNWPLSGTFVFHKYILFLFNFFSIFQQGEITHTLFFKFNEKFLWDTNAPKVTRTNILIPVGRNAHVQYESSNNYYLGKHLTWYAN